jgi:hypothetical protein
MEDLKELMLALSDRIETAKICQCIIEMESMRYLKGG